MAFTVQEKLALLMTSAGSFRNAAALVGVTHQRISRWLREGEPGGIRKIPAEYAGAIETAFRIHVQVSREQAKHDGIPFFPSVPLFLERKYLSRRAAKGKDEFGDQVFSGGTTEYIRQELRVQWLETIIASRRFHKVNVRSVVNMYLYAREEAIRINAERRERGVRLHNLDRKTDDILEGWVENENTHRDEDEWLEASLEQTLPIFTRNADARPGTRIKAGARYVEKLLQEKHSPAAEGPGTHFAHEYLLQLLPEGYEETLAKRRREGRARRRYVGSKRTTRR